MTVEEYGELYREKQTIGGLGEPPFDPDDSSKGVNWDDVPEKMDPSEIPNGGMPYDD